MGPRCAAKLGEDGTFRGNGPGAGLALAYDAVDDGWSLGRAAGSGTGALVARAASLDHGLAMLARASGCMSTFRVGLPCGESFLRPGKVPAPEVLAALGYLAVGAVTAYAVLARPSSVGVAEVRRELLSGLPGGVGLGEVEETDSEGGTTWWCCDLSVPFEGMLRLSEADAVVASALARCPFEPVGRSEVEAAALPTANSAKVLRFTLDHAA